MSHILPFIEFCADSYPDAKEITKEMLDHWLLTKNFNADSTRRIAIINIRHFARFFERDWEKGIYTAFRVQCQGTAVSAIHFYR